MASPTAALIAIKWLKTTVSAARDRTVEALKNTANTRKALVEHIDIEELWEILHSEQEWIDIRTMTELCFPDNPTPDHESAVIRAFFKNRTYFKFDADKLFPYTEEHVEKMAAKAEEEARKRLIVDYGSAWLKNVLDGRNDGDEAAAEKQVHLMRPAVQKEIANIARQPDADNESRAT